MCGRYVLRRIDLLRRAIDPIPFLPSFEEFADANAELFGPILQRYYRPETLGSDLARGVFVMPDRVNL